MNILHYSLGLAPYRSGGMTKYVTDLTVAQQQAGDMVSLLYPGESKFINREMGIIAQENYKGAHVYEIINPLPVPLLYGVKEPQKFKGVGLVNTAAFERLLLEEHIEIMHIHTLMGLPLEYLKRAKEMGVKLLYTSHDYYGICLKVNRIDWNGNICEEANAIKCMLCNKKSPNTLFLKIRNLHALTYLKKIH